jgi:hypothetical protein
LDRQNTQLFFKENYNELQWGTDKHSSYLKGYFEPLILNGFPEYITNISATPFIIKCGDLLLPGVLPGDLKDCYVSSPYSQYITYAQAELREIDSASVRLVLKLFLKALGVIAKLCDINKVVYVNNWLLSTNLYPDIKTETLREIKEALESRYPDRVIIFRSLNEKCNEPLMRDLYGLGASRTLSRQVYISDPFKKDYLERKDFHKDKKFLVKTKFEVKKTGFNELDINQIKLLYDKLYIDKYFDLNPQFTYKFFENAVKNNLFNFQLLTSENKPKAVLGYFSRNYQMTTPIFGFETDAPAKEGLYRLISAILMQESEKHSLMLNQSSGASHFKSQRGASPYIEYNYYFVSHVGIKQKTIWRILSAMLNSIGIYTLKKMKL